MYNIGGASKVQDAKIGESEIVDSKVVFDKSFLGECWKLNK